MMCKVTLSAAALAFMCGCSVGPSYTPPATAAPVDWSEALGDGLASENTDLSVWWRAFGDSTLDMLVDRALVQSLELREAASRVREARALRGVTAADRLPTLDARGAATYSRDSRNTFGGSFDTGGRNIELYDAGFDASWELDLFGRVRRSVEAADAQLESAYESERDARVTLLSEIARNYMEFRSSQARLRLAHENVRIQEDTLDISRERFRAGISTELQVAQAEAQLQSIRSRIPLLTMDLKSAAFRLDVLLGLQPGSLMAELAPERPVPAAQGAIGIGLPADLLRRRPDIRRAERELAAATARVGIATADLYPRLTLNGSFGFQSERIGNLFESDSVAWSAGPLAVRWPIFNAGRVRSAIRVQEARQEIAIVAYERTVLNAYEEVANALVAYARLLERRESLSLAVEASALAVELSNDLWSRGLTDFLNVLDSQREHFLLEDQLAECDADVATNLVAIYKALGGGWDTSSIQDGQVVDASPSVTNNPSIDAGIVVP